MKHYRYASFNACEAVLRKRVNDEGDRHAFNTTHMHRSMPIGLSLCDITVTLRAHKAARTGIGHNRVRRQARYRCDMTFREPETRLYLSSAQ